MSRFTEMVPQYMPQYGKLSGWLCSGEHWELGVQYTTCSGVYTVQYTTNSMMQVYSILPVVRQMYNWQYGRNGPKEEELWRGRGGECDISPPWSDWCHQSGQSGADGTKESLTPATGPLWPCMEKHGKKSQFIFPMIFECLFNVPLFP